MKNQRKKPCAECPFRRGNQAGLGGSHPDVYVGQINWSFWLPCHMDKSYVGKASGVNDVCECAGAAIMRSNMGIADHIQQSLLHLPADGGEQVFTDLPEFYSYYTGLSRDEAKEVLTDERVRELVHKALTDAGVRVQLKRKDT